MNATCKLVKAHGREYLELSFNDTVYGPYHLDSNATQNVEAMIADAKNYGYSEIVLKFDLTLISGVWKQN